LKRLYQNGIELVTRLRPIATVTDVYVVDVLEFRTVSSIGPSDVMAVSGSVDPLADPG